MLKVRTTVSPASAQATHDPCGGRACTLNIKALVIAFILHTMSGSAAPDRPQQSLPFTAGVPFTVTCRDSQCSTVTGEAEQATLPPSTGRPQDFQALQESCPEGQTCHVQSMATPPATPPATDNLNALTSVLVSVPAIFSVLCMLLHDIMLRLALSTRRYLWGRMMQVMHCFVAVCIRLQVMHWTVVQYPRPGFWVLLVSLIAAFVECRQFTPLAR
mmetsp:Transcript_15468/g.36940  ORF Transcript_15468/g.36940 Transcript_15468/m.36940 type:complete len:216 (-) Transcript_15468:122-769(-)